MENKYIELLNPEQEKAVRHITGPLMVIAGAGSGKTRVLTSRITHLIHNKINALNILALTFTNKAAKEMKQRIENIVGENQTQGLWMGTFHSVFSRILRSESERLNYPKNFTIYDTDDSKSLIRSIIRELNLDKDTYKVSMIRNRISSLKNNFITSKEYIKNKELIESDRIAKRSEFNKIYNMYERRCYNASVMDFDDLLIKTYELLRADNEVLLKYQNKFKYILIDEYQDTNHIQYLIIKKLAALHQNICVVGDDAQSIYSFRGANIENILNFKVDYPNYKSYKLEQNYRSTSTIVNAANNVIQKNKKQIQKNVWTSNKEGEKIIVTKTNSDNEEGRLVANTIYEIQTRKGITNKDFAILYRTNAQSRPLEEALRKRNIAYKIYGGVSFYQRKEIKDILAYCRLIINPNDEEAFKRIINYPARGIGGTTVQKINIASQKRNQSLWQTINNLSEININKGTLEKLKDFSFMINSFIMKSNKADAYDISEEIVKKTGLFNHLYTDRTPEGISRFENIQELLNGIKDFTENRKEGENKLSDFMNEVSLITDQDNEKKEDLNKVTLMTIHASKGLEFPYVFIVGLEENLFPSMMSGQNEKEIEEERRLFYVAITRAQKRVFLSFAITRFKWGQFIDCKPSRFINEIEINLLQKKETNSKRNKEPNKIHLRTRKINKPIVKSNNLKRISNKENSKSIDTSKIQNGANVIHSKFGEGKVITITGDGSNKRATVFFNKFGQKQLLLKFARLKILE